jgi:hypothetical protein
MSLKSGAPLSVKVTEVIQWIAKSEGQFWVKFDNIPLFKIYHNFIYKN